MLLNLTTASYKGADQHINEYLKADLTVRAACKYSFIGCIV